MFRDFALRGPTTLACLLLLLIGGLGEPVQAQQELRGRVDSLEGTRVRIVFDGPERPIEGATVRLGQRIEGWDEPIFMEGTWEVVTVDGDGAWAVPAGSSEAAPAPGYLAIVDTPSVQTMTESGGGKGGGSYTDSGGESGEAAARSAPMTASLEDLGAAALADALTSEARADVDTALRERTGHAMNEVGRRYLFGRQMPENRLLAAAWYRHASEHGSVFGTANLGDLYWNGWGVAQDDRAAVRLYERAAAAGNGIARRMLGLAYQLGRGVAQDYAMARRWYEDAITAGNPSGHNSLGRLYLNGWGVPRDHALAVAHFEQAAANDVPYGLFNLGLCYESGWGVSIDESRAQELYIRAARLDVPEAQERLRERGIQW